MKVEVRLDEPERLKVLYSYEILDTPPEQAFDDLTRLAAHICHTPIALLTLVDANRQWFKSKVGLQTREEPPETGFCSHAVLQQDVLVVTDAIADERFAANPWISSEPGIRFYAGAPLIAPERQAIGTLCVLDYMPRQLEPAQIDALQTLAHQAIVHLELKRSLRGLEQNLADRQKLEQELRKSVAKEQTKGELISIVSHELRTPLTSIQGSLAYLYDRVATIEPDKARKLVDLASRSGQRMMRLINDMLDVDKIESGKMVFQLKPLEISILVQQAIESNQPYADQFGVKLFFEQSLAGARVSADNDRLMQVITNLLSNAAKFSPPGGVVSVSVSRRGEYIRISVTDMGSGIPEQFRSQVFQKFAQADTSTSRQHKGSGLGLSISKAIVERLGGAIGFESQPGIETTFYVDLPEMTSL